MLNTILDVKKVEKEAMFDKIEEWMSEGAITNAVALSAMEKLEKNGIDGDYVRDVLRAQVRRQTGAKVEELSDLALSMALEREESGSCVDGTGWRLADVLERFVDVRMAKVRLDTKVNGFKRDFMRDGKAAWILELTSSAAKSSELTYEDFDKVIIATPWDVNFLHGDQDEGQEAIIYRSLRVDFVASKSKLLPEFFGDSDKMPSQLLNLETSAHLRGLDVQEISLIREVHHPFTPNNTFIYRIIYSENPRSKVPAILWGGPKEIEGLYNITIENAYPVLSPRTDGFGKFNLGEGIWWTGGVEAIASQLDLAWVAGENVAQLVARDIIS